MNDKWFNIAMIIVFTSLVANGFVFMLTGFPNGGTYNGVSYSSLHQTGLDYSTNASSIKYTYQADINSGDKLSSTTTDTFNPITTILGDPFGLTPIYLLATAFFGLELMLITLASIFTVFSVVIYTIILVMFTVKIIVVAYFASILIRSIFGGRA